MKNSPLSAEDILLDSQIRLVLKIDKLQIRVTNNAPDYVKLSDDKPEMVFKVQNAEDPYDVIFSDKYLMYRNTEKDSAGNYVLQERTTHFDFDKNQINKIWTSNFDFYVNSYYSRYLKYDIEELSYSIELLQNKTGTDELESVSISKREYQSPVDENEPAYSLKDIEAAAELLGRTVKKIDLRTGATYIKLTLPQKELEPIMQRMANKLGYELSNVDEHTLGYGKKRDQLPTHVITLKRNY